MNVKDADRISAVALVVESETDGDSPEEPEDAQEALPEEGSDD